MRFWRRNLKIFIKILVYPLNSSEVRNFYTFSALQGEGSEEIRRISRIF
jgi:hypothetical protein